MRRNAFARFLQTLYRNPPDAGAGSGGDASSAGAGPGAGGEATGGGAATPSAYRLSDDAMVDFGDGVPVKWSEARSQRYIPRDEFNRFSDALKTTAQSLDQREAALRRQAQGSAQGQSRQPQADRFAEVRGLPIVDGQTLARYAEQFEGQFGQVMSAVAQKMQALEAQQQRLQGATAPLAEQHSQQAFESFIDRSFTEAMTQPIKGLPDGVAIDTKSEFVREMARDVYLSHDQNSWRPGEFAKALRGRVEGAIALVRELNKAAVQRGEERKRQFFANSGGNGQGSGAQRQAPMTNRERARMLFAATETPT